jgi:putative ATPase
LNSALLSRCRVIVLNKLPPDSVRKILERALQSKDIFVRKSGEKFEKTSKGVSIDEEAVDYLATICDGDARTALNCLEIAISKHEAEGKKLFQSIKTFFYILSCKTLFYILSY